MLLTRRLEKGLISGIEKQSGWLQDKKKDVTIIRTAGDTLEQIYALSEKA